MRTYKTTTTRITITTRVDRHPPHFGTIETIGKDGSYVVLSATVPADLARAFRALHADYVKAATVLAGF